MRFIFSAQPAAELAGFEANPSFWYQRVLFSSVGGAFFLNI
jgi:hypothetical protein